MDADDPDAMAALMLIEHLTRDVEEAKDNLLASKVTQAEFANQHSNDRVVFLSVTNPNMY